MKSISHDNAGYLYYKNVIVTVYAELRLNKALRRAWFVLIAFMSLIDLYL